MRAAICSSAAQKLAAGVISQAEYRTILAADQRMAEAAAPPSRTSPAAEAGDSTPRRRTMRAHSALEKVQQGSITRSEFDQILAVDERAAAMEASASKPPARALAAGSQLQIDFLMAAEQGAGVAGAGRDSASARPGLPVTPVPAADDNDANAGGAAAATPAAGPALPVEAHATPGAGLRLSAGPAQRQDLLGSPPPCPACSCAGYRNLVEALDRERNATATLRWTAEREMEVLRRTVHSARLETDAKAAEVTALHQSLARAEAEQHCLLRELNELREAIAGPSGHQAAGMMSGSPTVGPSSPGAVRVSPAAPAALSSGRARAYTVGVSAPERSAADRSTLPLPALMRRLLKRTASTFSPARGAIAAAETSSPTPRAVDFMKVELMLQHVPLLQHFDVYERTVVAQSMEVQEIRAGTVITKEGEAGAALFLVVAGELSASRRSEFGTAARSKLVKLPDLEVKRLSVGAYFGEDALLRKRPSRVSVAALQESVCLALQQDVFQRLLKRFERTVCDSEQVYKSYAEANHELVSSIREEVGRATDEAEYLAVLRKHRHAVSGLRLRSTLTERRECRTLVHYPQAKMDLVREHKIKLGERMYSMGNEQRYDDFVLALTKAVKRIMHPRAASRCQDAQSEPEEPDSAKLTDDSSFADALDAKPRSAQQHLRGAKRGAFRNARNISLVGERDMLGDGETAVGEPAAALGVQQKDDTRIDRIVVEILLAASRTMHGGDSYNQVSLLFGNPELVVISSGASAADGPPQLEILTQFDGPEPKVTVISTNLYRLTHFVDAVTPKLWASLETTVVEEMSLFKLAAATFETKPETIAQRTMKIECIVAPGAGGPEGGDHDAGCV